MEERWLAVPGYEGLYEVSDLGRLKRKASRVRCGTNGNGEKALPERIVPPTPVDRGYLRVNLWKDNRYKQYQVHRLVLETFRGVSDLSVDHLNGDTSDNRLSNLQYCSLAENTKRQHEDGRVVFVRGHENGRSKLRSTDIPAIRRMISEGMKYADIAATFSVTRGAIQAVKDGRTWGHVPQ